MTKINRITIHGFKSFAHKTEIPFDNKFNCILGPNGSGKSNIGDALCFVLGRLSAKSMRAEKAANLIFNGGKKKQPAPFASVEITFDNKNKTFSLEDSEIVIKRLITKTGNSVYKINGKKCTRSEILDLLSTARINPEGYNIILQGDVTRFVDMPPMERRKIIEQISEVSVYEEKKHKALLELEKVEEQLNNAEVILKERKVYLKELKKDRDQALKFKELKEMIDSNKATFLHLQLKEKEKVKEKYDQEIAEQQKKINHAESRIIELKETVETYKKEVGVINHEIEQKGEKEQLKVHRDLEDLKVILAEERTRISSLKDEINKINLRKDQFKVEIKELEEKSASVAKQKKDLEGVSVNKKRELQELEQAIEQFKKKNKIETSHELETEIDDKDKLIEQKQEEVQKERQKQQEMLREKDRLEYQVQTLDERIKKVREVEKENKEQIRVLQQQKENFKNATLRLNRCLDQDSSFAAQLANAKRNLAEIQERQAQLQAKANIIQAGLSNNKAIKSILDHKNRFKGVHGTIVELGQVNKKYSLALEMSAGAKMQQIVVDNDDIAADCIKYLKKEKLGSASFIPLNKIKYKDISIEDKKFLKRPGVHDFALNLISFKPQYKKAFNYVFGNTLIVEDIDKAKGVGVGKIKMSTLDGNVVETSGVMKGGFIEKKNQFGFKESDSLEELEKVDEQVLEVYAILSNLEIKREANLKEIGELRNLKAELEAEVIKLEKILHLGKDDLDATGTLQKEFNSRLKEVDQQLVEIQKNVTLMNRDLAELKSKKQILRSQVSELRNPRLLAQLSAFEESRQKCREDLLKLESELKNNLVHLEQMIAPERDKIKEIIKQHDKEEMQFNNEIKKLAISIKEKEKELEMKEKESKNFYSKYKELFSNKEKLSTDINKVENEIENIREKSRTAEREINLVSLKNAEIKAKLAGLEEQFNSFKEAKLLKDKSIEELNQEIHKFEIMLAQMSAVNMKALEVYEQVESEFNKLVEKKEGLIKEKTDVLTLMNEIETKKKEHFMKTFEQANQNFERIFSTLFTKGKAYLQLDNPTNPFEEGLSIKVKLTGKRFMDIKSLSGGEKTLTALSFIFAIQEYQPASFYILDEIDAALDKHNSQRLSKLIRNYSDRAQYVVISHNDSLISEADTLYGVSMNDGVSKVTSIKI